MKKVNSFRFKGKDYTAVLIKRPFREGLELRLLEKDSKKKVRIGDLGLGRQALMEKLGKLS